MARRTAWEDTIIDRDVANAGQASQQVMSTVTADEMRGSTLTRLIGELGLYSNTVAGAYGVQAATIGIATLDEDAFVAGAVPDPSSETDEPPRGWVYWTQCLVSQNGVGTTIAIRCMFDLHSQRRMDGSVLVVVVDSISVIGTSFSIGVNGIVRTLLLLP